MDPLAQLKDIHLPEPVHNYPLAYGWWIVLFIVLALSIWFIRKIIADKKLSKAKKHAIKQLTNHDLSSDEVMTLLKWSALQYFPRQQVANLHGSGLQHFLAQCLPTKQRDDFNTLIEPSLIKQYQAQPNANELASLKKATLLWLTTALPPKNKVGDDVNVNASNVEVSSVSVSQSSTLLDSSAGGKA